MRPSVPDVHISDSQDEEFAAYRALAGQAVAGLILGLLAPVALIGPTLWAVPFLGLFFSGWALRRIRRNASALTGRKLAWAGLSLSLLFAVAAPTDWLAYRRIIADEAQQFSTQWLRYLTLDEPQKAHQLTVVPQNRQTLDQKLWAYYRNNERQWRDLEGYVKSTPVRTLLALGSKAVVRFYETAGQVHENDNDVVEQLYAVTFEEDGEKKSFFVSVQTLRTKLADGKADWRILKATVGVTPTDW